MKNEKQQKLLDKPKASPLSDRVLSRIEGEDIRPCPKWQFWLQHTGIWILWGLSVTLGAIALAVIIYVGEHARFALYEATHETALSFFIEILPYIWILCFLLMAVLAYLNMRHTKHGYRYPMWKVIGSSIFFSIAGGFVLYFTGFGYLIDNSLKGMPLYPSMNKIEMKMWQMPNEGRLVAVFEKVSPNGMSYIVIDTHGVSWEINTLELNEKDLELLRSGNSVRLLGTTTNATNNKFHACGVFPWMFDKKSKGFATDDREGFIKRMYEHIEADERLEAFEEEKFNEKTYGKPFIQGICADIAAVKRLRLR